MKKYITISLLTAGLFITLTLKTATLKGGSDGDDTYGFPLTFYIRYSGMCDPCPPNPQTMSVNTWPLIIDIVVSFIGALLIWKIIYKIISSIRKHNA
jgi:hypothetical protein